MRASESIMAVIRIKEEFLFHYINHYEVFVQNVKYIAGELRFVKGNCTFGICPS